MVLLIFRALFIIIIFAVLFVNLTEYTVSGEEGRATFYIILWSGLAMAVGAFLIDVLTPKKSLASLAGVFFGLLVGILVTWSLSPVLFMVNEIFYLALPESAMEAVQWILGVCLCYLSISIVIRTKDDVRFVIPYVEFAKQTKGARPLILDTSAIIDGRIADLYKSKLFDAPLVVPRFVLNELQLIADSSDKLKRNRGRRGLDILKEMRADPIIDVEIDETVVPDTNDVKGVDQKLVVFGKNCNGRIVTTDYNLTKVAQLREVDVVNINDMANSFKTVALPGEPITVRVVKPGEEADQGIGYLEDGTMVVIEGARTKIGKEIILSVTSSLQTSAGKMVFGKFEDFARNNHSAERKTTTTAS